MVMSPITGAAAGAQTAFRRARFERGLIGFSAWRPAIQRITRDANTRLSRQISVRHFGFTAKFSNLDHSVMATFKTRRFVRRRLFAGRTRLRLDTNLSGPSTALRAPIFRSWHVHLSPNFR